MYISGMEYFVRIKEKTSDYFTSIDKQKQTINLIQMTISNEKLSC